MFWRVATFHQASPVEAILDREGFSLEELLDEDEIIQECKTSNTRLVAYLNKRETIETLIGYLSEPPDNDADFRYSFTACEIFCCELDDLFNTLMEDEKLMISLFSLLDKSAPLNSTLAGYFGRVVGSLLMKRPVQTHEYLESHNWLLPKLITHIDTTSIVEVVLRLVGAEEANTTVHDSPGNLPDWLANTDLMKLLLDRLCCDITTMTRTQRRLQKAAQCNVSSILVAIASTQPSRMADQLTQRDYLRTMLQHASNPESDLLSPVLDVCIALLDPVRTRPSLSTGWSALVPPTTLNSTASVDMDLYGASMRAAAEEIVQFLPQFTDLLDAEDEEGEQEQPYGTLKPRLGRRRLTVIEFGNALLSSNLPLAVRAIMTSQFVHKAMRLFQEFPFNNILHNHVYQMFEYLLDTLYPDHSEGSSGDVTQATSTDRSQPVMPDVVDFLVDNCKLLEWIVALASMPYVTPSTDRFQIKKPSKLLSAAYHGHVTDLANKVLKIAQDSNNDALLSALQLSNDWQNYEVNILVPRTKVQDVNDWGVGRPPTTEHTLSSQDDDDDPTRPLYVGKQDDGENPMTLEHYGGGSFHDFNKQTRYGNDIEEDADEEDQNSDGSSNSVEDSTYEGPESHQLEDEDSDSDSSDGDNRASYLLSDVSDAVEQTIEDEDEVELGDEATALAEQVAEEVDEDTELGFTQLAIESNERVDAESTARGSDSQEMLGTGAAVPAATELRNFWKIPVQALSDEV